MRTSTRARGSASRLFAVFAAVALVGCQSNPPATLAPSATAGSPTAVPTKAATRGGGGTLTLFYWQAPTILNPHLSQGVKDQSASRVTYEPLASFDADGNLIPFLAAEIPTTANGGLAADGKSVTWKLKAGVKWSDGTPFSADDVRFTWQYATNPAVAAISASAYAGVTDVEVVDPTTVTVHFSDSTPAWSIPFTGVYGMIIPKHLFEAYNGANAADAPGNLKPVGTGPYRVVSFVNEDVLIVAGDTVKTTKITYELNPEYREPGKPFFDKVELRGGGGDAVVASELMTTGQSDFAWNLQVDDAESDRIEASGKSKMIAIFGAFTERIMLNFSDPNKATADGERSSRQFPNPVLSDPAVRLAIARGVDRVKIAALYGRYGQATDTLLVSPGNFRSGHAAPAFNLDEAKRLLDEAGWIDHDGDGVRDKGGVPLKLLFQTSINPVRQQAQAIVKTALDSIGFAVQLKNIDSSIFLGKVEGTTETRRQFYADLEEFAFSNKSPDPAVYMGGWTCEQIAQKADNWSRSNFSRYCNPAFDDLYNRSRTELDPAARIGLFKQMNDMLVEDGAVIPLVHLADVSGRSLSLLGTNLTPWDVDVWNIADWTRT
ncbi:MAG: peptide ABC transporter substrate-binding protein [Chloroflexi bacterium]|nr:peptide ABC transporter substrate-binding protein [Chloroflexota bacterium]